MTAIIDGERVSHEITQKQYDKFMAIDDYHRLKLFSKVFGEVDMKSRDRPRWERKSVPPCLPAQPWLRNWGMTTTAIQDR